MQHRASNDQRLLTKQAEFDILLHFLTGAKAGNLAQTHWVLKRQTNRQTDRKRERERERELWGSWMQTNVGEGAATCRHIHSLGWEKRNFPTAGWSESAPPSVLVLAHENGWLQNNQSTRMAARQSCSLGVSKLANGIRVCVRFMVRVSNGNG